jgi:glycosyltransferase involved in cell wall biosynthesis
MLYNSISIIVPTRNSIRTISNCIDSIISQNLSGYTCELIIVDNFSTDGTSEYLQSKVGLHNFRWFSLGPERSEQRNYGIANSKYDLVAYIDSDMYLTSNLIKNILDLFNSQEIDAVKVPEIIYGNSLLNKARRFERMLYSDSLIDSARFMKKSIFLEVGGFHEGIPGSEDWELDAKLIENNAKFYYLDQNLKCFNLYLDKYHHSLKLEGFVHDEGDISLKKLLEKKNYYKAADDYIFNFLSEIKSPMLKVFSISYRLGLIFKWKNIFKYSSQYIYLPVVLFYRALHLMNVKIFKY